MTDKKYIVKNCPNLSESYYADGHISHNECSLEIDDKQCADCTDCLIRQVIDKCRKSTYKITLPLTKQTRVKTKQTAQQILQLFEIEECE